MLQDRLLASKATFRCGVLVSELKFGCLYLKNLGVKLQRFNYAALASCASHVTRHTSHVTRHTSHVTQHLQRRDLLKRRLIMKRIGSAYCKKFNLTRAWRHTSHVTRHTSRKNLRELMKTKQTTILGPCSSNFTPKAMAEADHVDGHLNACDA